MDYCNALKLLFGLTVQVLVWIAASASLMDVDIGKLDYRLFYVKILKKNYQR